MQAEKNYAISEKLANEMLQYLAIRPYGEVFQLVRGLQEMQEIDVHPQLPATPAGELKP